jgi:hypothetical protein
MLLSKSAMLLKKNNEVPIGTSFFLLLSDKTIKIL